MSGSGSITGYPNFPDITGLTQQDITNDINTAQTAYQTALSNFNTKNILSSASGQAVLTARAALQADQENLAQLQANNGTPDQIAAAQQQVATDEATYNTAMDAFTAGQADFNKAADDLVTATNALFQNAVPYVTALALQQLYNANESDQTIAGLITQIGTLVGSSSTNQYTPDWMLSTIINSNPNLTQQEIQNITTAFNNWGLNQYNTAYYTNDFISNYTGHLKAYYSWISQGGSGTYDFSSDGYWTTACADQDQINAYNGARTSILQTLDTALESLDAPLQSAFQYLQSGSDLMSQLMQSFTQSYQSQLEADQAALQQEQSVYPSQAQYIQQTAGPQITQLQEQLQTLTVPTGVDFPVLPPATSNMSMSELMSIISQVQLMIQQLSQYERELDNRHGSVWTSTLLLEYEMEEVRASAYNQWVNLVQQADAQYNATVIQDNTATINNATTSLQFLLDNSSQIQNIMSQANTQIDAWNTLITSASGTNNGATFITACNSISSDLVSQITEAENTAAEYPTYLDFFNFEPALPSQTPPTVTSLFPNPSSYEKIPDATLDTTTIQNLITTLNTALTSSTSTIDLTQLNNDLQSVVTDLAPVLDRIQALVPGGQSVNFQEIYLREEVPPKAFTPYQPQFLLQLIKNILDLIKNANIDEQNRAALTKVLSGLMTVISARSDDLQRQQIVSPGVGFGLEASSFQQYPPDVSQLAQKIAESEILAMSLYSTLENSSIVAGLTSAGSTMKGLNALMGVTTSVAELFEDLGLNLNTFLEQQSTQQLFLSFAEQLALAAAQPPSLQQTAVNILSQVPGATNLTPDQVKDMIASLQQLLQFLLMFMSMFMAALAGVGSAQFLTQVVGQIGGVPQALVAALQSLGLSQEKINALGIALGGNASGLQQILSSMGLDPNASSIILALIAAQIGNVSLTQGVVGGPAFLDALLKQLAAAGITITAPIGTDQFMQQLLAALQAKATPEQFTMLQNAINQIEQAAAGTQGQVLSIEQITNELIDKIIADLQALSAAQVTAPPSAPPLAGAVALAPPPSAPPPVTPPTAPPLAGAVALAPPPSAPPPVTPPTPPPIAGAVTLAPPPSAPPPVTPPTPPPIAGAVTLAPPPSAPPPVTPPTPPPIAGAVTLAPPPITPAAPPPPLVGAVALALPPSAPPPVTPPPTPSPLAGAVALAPPPITPTAPPPPPTIPPPAILPSDILAQYVSQFQKLPATVQSALTTLAQTQLSTIQGLTDEQKASLLVAVKLGETTVTEALALTLLVNTQNAGILQYNDTITKIISRLFQESPEAKQAREDALKQAIVNQANRTQELLPNALPQRIVDDIASSFKSIINNFDNQDFAIKILDNFATYVEKLSSFAKVGEMLLDPGKLLLRMFSVVLTTSQDRARRPPTLFGG